MQDLVRIRDPKIYDHMIYPIVKYGNPVLEKPAEPVIKFDDELKKLVEDKSDAYLAGLKRGGHDPIKVFNAYRAATAKG